MIRKIAPLDEVVLLPSLVLLGRVLVQVLERAREISR
jgi:hypothetical protein